MFRKESDYIEDGVLPSLGWIARRYPEFPREPYSTLVFPGSNKKGEYALELRTEDLNDPNIKIRIQRGECKEFWLLEEDPKGSVRLFLSGIFYGKSILQGLNIEKVLGKDQGPDNKLLDLKLEFEPDKNIPSADLLLPTNWQYLPKRKTADIKTIKWNDQVIGAGTSGGASVIGAFLDLKGLINRREMIKYPQSLS